MDKNEVIKMIDDEIEKNIEIRATLDAIQSISPRGPLRDLAEKMSGNYKHDVDILKKIKQYINQ